MGSVYASYYGLLSMIVPFNKPYMTGDEFAYIKQSHEHSQLAGDGPFTKECHKWIETTTGSAKALLSHSCTAALEMSALLMNIEPGDEIIMPSYTFVSTANAFALRGGVPVFVDIRGDTLNLDECLLEEAITSKTKAIVPVHYAGVACEMDAILDIASRYGLWVVEDAAQGMMAKYKGRALGSIGDLGAYSFHETKNVISGEGGALVVNNSDFVLSAEIIREKGTDRSQFFRGNVDKYTWQSLGSSFLPGELIAAFLWAQLQHATEITRARLESWNYYHAQFASLAETGVIARPIIPNQCEHNGHMYYLVLRDDICRSTLLSFMSERGVNAVFHYVPLHTSPAGMKYSRACGDLDKTTRLSQQLIRLPLWVGLTTTEQDYVCACVCDAIAAQC